MERPNLSAIGKIIKEKWNCTDHHLFSGTNSHDQYHPSETPWNINKNYTCSFCKRQFKSAQALGGHMNVHRRERARLRLFSPLTLGESCSNNNYNPNPSPKFSSLSSSSSSAATPSAKFLPHNYIPHDHSMLISPPPLLPPPAHHHHHPLTSLSLPDHDHRLASTEKDMNKTIFDFPGSGTTTNIPLITTSQGRMKDMKTKSMKSPLLEDGDLKCYSQQTDSLKAFTTENNIIRLDLEMGLLKDQKDDVDLELRLGSTYF